MTATSLDDLELELRKLPGVRSIGFSEKFDVLLVQVQVIPETVDSSLALQATRIACRHSERPVAVEIVRWRTPGAAIARGGETESVPGFVAAPAPALDFTTATAPVETPSAPASQASSAYAAPEPEPAPEPATQEPQPGSTTEAPMAPASVFVETSANNVPPADESPSDAPTAGETPTLAATASHDDVTRERRVRLLAVLTFPETDELEVHLTLDGKRAIGRSEASKELMGSVAATIDALRVFVPGLVVQPAWAQIIETPAEAPILVAIGITSTDSVTRHGLAGGASAIEAAGRATLHALNRFVAYGSPTN